MRLTSFAPEYQTLELHLTGEKNKIGVKAGEQDLRKYKGSEIGLLGIGLVETFASADGHADSSLATALAERTGKVLDALSGLGVEKLFLVKYSSLPGGASLIGCLSEFEPAESEPDENTKVYASACRNPALDTELIRDLNGVKVLIVAGMQAYTNVLSCVDLLMDRKQSGSLALEEIYVVDSCTKTTSAVASASERDFWAKQMMQEMGAKIVNVYIGDTKIA